jgi:predicted cation transporter
MNISLALIFAAVLFFPFLIKPVEERLELFLLGAGLAAMTAGRAWSFDALIKALEGPLGLALAVFLSDLLFNAFRSRLAPALAALESRWGPRRLAFLLIGGLGLASCLMTAVAAALALCEAVRHLKVSSATRLKLVVLGCYAIGVGSALTPWGGPLAAITLSRLQQDSLFLVRLLGAWALVLIFGFALAAAWLKPGVDEAAVEDGAARAGAAEAAWRSLKIYGFMLGLEFLGEGFKPLALAWIGGVSPSALFWTNTASAVLDNATLAAAEVSTNMDLVQLKYAFLGLVISGGMLVPGNLPNLVCAGALKLRPKAWAAFALPLGLAVMTAVFLKLRFFS